MLITYGKGFHNIMNLIFIDLMLLTNILGINQKAHTPTIGHIMLVMHIKTIIINNYHII